MSNQEIARIFAEIADMLEIKGEQVFKIRAYRKAAEAVAAFPEPLSAFAQRDKLTAIPGVGPSIAAKIGELLESGQCAYHQELMAEFSPGLIGLLRVPEVGPRTALLLYQELGIKDVDGLEAAAREQRLRGVRGLGAKTEENILRGIARLRARSGNMPLAVAHPHALQIMAALQATAPIDRIAVAGSIRRMRDLVGDIDILVTSPDPAAVMEAVPRLEMVREVVATGPTKTSAITTQDAEVDVRVLEPESFGAGLQYFTGSQAHSVRLREIAVKRGLKLNEYGVFCASTGERLGGATEEEMYGALGMPLIPPEIRENTGEIELALQGRLPLLVSENDLHGDLHVHTDWSDGRGSIERMAEAALARGYEYLAICDHSQSRAIARGLSPERLQEQRQEIARIQERFPNLRLLAGLECDIRRDGSLDCTDEVLAELDVVVASVHSAFNIGEADMTERVLAAIRSPYVDIIGHPTGRIVGERDPYALDIERVLAEAARLGVAMEINAFPDRLDLKDAHARRAQELGVVLAINTDAHALGHLDLVHYGVATARRGWVAPSSVLNALPLAELLPRLHRERHA